MHVISITNSEYKSWMLRDGFRTHKDSASVKLIKMYVTFDLSEIEEMTLQGRAGENLS